MAKRHKDVEFSVDDASGGERIFKTFDEAAGFAVALAASGRKSSINILVYSRSGAKWLAGDEGVAEYEEDPDASVFRRIVIKADDQGRVS